jgi:hypothetical protein
MAAAAKSFHGSSDSGFYGGSVVIVAAEEKSSAPTARVIADRDRAPGSHEGPASAVCAESFLKQMPELLKQVIE